VANDEYLEVTQRVRFYHFITNCDA